MLFWVFHYKYSCSILYNIVALNIDHPNVKAFISHGGRLSTMESIFFGVPFVGIPIFAEQPYNIAQAVHAGYGTKLDFQDLTAETLYNAIVEITSNPK